MSEFNIGNHDWSDEEVERTDIWVEDTGEEILRLDLGDGWLCIDVKDAIAIAKHFGVYKLQPSED